ncbi:LysR substrate-binding domain-containing protein [uncultured Caballeronia sp.]|uniref:LysR substrate-binding domain-containing protein n=1 Tax=uncultured Caballeronia sp. TaxID=1827198 RepID=UPI0035CC1A22
MSRRLPPFAAIRAFEAAARHCNLRLASEELYLSISAVSHQLKSLEQFLGIQLFNRTHNTLELTNVGQTYMKSLAEALDLIASATAKTEAIRNTTSISINTFPSLAVLWLMPRLSTFYRQYPEVDVNILTSIEPLTFRSGLVELAIRYEDLKTVPTSNTVLFEEKIYPVCSPQYAADAGLLDPNATFGNVTVIQCQTSPNEWEDWFKSVNAADIKPFRVLNVDNRALALQAAESGLGVAMGRTPFAERLLTEKRLCRLMEQLLPTGFGYTVCLSDSAVRSPAVKAFASWLVEQGTQSSE